MVIKTAQSLARKASRTASGLATDMALKAANKVAGGVVDKVAGRADRLAAEVGRVADRINPRRVKETAVKIEVRKVVTLLEDIWHEGGPRAKKPHKRGAIAAVIKNPFAGGYVQDIMPMMDALKPLGYELAEALIKALGGGKKIEAYGKGAIIGMAGELEHGALWHVPGGYGMRELMDKSLAIVPSAKKVGAMGAAIDIPLHHRTASYVRSHFDAFEVRIPDAPRADEIVYILAMSTGARVHARVGGLSPDDIAKFDGQR
jgi:hypothetical protein